MQTIEKISYYICEFGLVGFVWYVWFCMFGMFWSAYKAYFVFFTFCLFCMFCMFYIFSCITYFACFTYFAYFANCIFTNICIAVWSNILVSKGQFVQFSTSLLVSAVSESRTFRETRIGPGFDKNHVQHLPISVRETTTSWCLLSPVVLT